jgi:hypothetical protein
MANGRRWAGPAGRDHRPTTAPAAVREITARLTEQHGAAAIRDLTDALARELIDANSAVAPMNTADGNGADEHNGNDTRFDGCRCLVRRPAGASVRRA